VLDGNATAGAHWPFAAALDNGRERNRSRIEFLSRQDVRAVAQDNSVHGLDFAHKNNLLSAYAYTVSAD